MEQIIFDKWSGDHNKENDREKMDEDKKERLIELIKKAQEEEIYFRL